MVSSRVSLSRLATSEKLSVGWSCHGHNIILMALRKSDVCEEGFGVGFLRKRDQSSWPGGWCRPPIQGAGNCKCLKIQTETLPTKLLDQAIDGRKAQKAEANERYNPKCAIAMIE
jgi:hypothetical protein